MYPKITHQCTPEPLLERTLRVLSQFCSKCTHFAPEPLIKSSFKIYSGICPKLTQWVHLKLLKRNSQCGSILPQTLKEPVGYIAGHIVVNVMIFTLFLLSSHRLTYTSFLFHSITPSFSLSHTHSSIGDFGLFGQLGLLSNRTTTPRNPPQSRSPPSPRTPR